MATFRSAAERVRAQSIALSLCASIDRWRIQFREIERKFGLNDAKTKRRAFRWELAAFQFKSALLRYVELDEKAGFREDQPRDDLGRWSGGGGTAPSGGQNSTAQAKGGHHYVPQKLFNDPELRLRPETKRVFDQARTGPLKGGAHQWSKEQGVYNEAVYEHFHRFLGKNGIESQDMTPDHARRFLKEVQEFRDPRIRNFNMRIWMQEFRYYLRRVPGRQDWRQGHGRGPTLSAAA